MHMLGGSGVGSRNRVVAIDIGDWIVILAPILSLT